MSNVGGMLKGLGKQGLVMRYICYVATTKPAGAGDNTYLIDMAGVGY